jgi:hypothetical protein
MEDKIMEEFGIQPNLQTEEIMNANEGKKR